MMARMIPMIHRMWIPRMKPIIRHINPRISMFVVYESSHLLSMTARFQYILSAFYPYRLRGLI